MGQSYNLRYRLESPMRIGHRKVGNLQTTRLFVPGIAVWAATVNRLARQWPKAFPGSNPFHAWGRFLCRHVRFSSIFFLDPESGDPVLPGDPKQAEAVVRLGEEFLDGSVHTAVHRRKAEEGSLHELEWVLPVGRNGRKAVLCGRLDLVDNTQEGGGVALTLDEGRPWLQGAEHKVPLEEIMATLAVGADRSHRCGRLGLQEMIPARDGAEEAVRLAADAAVPGWLVAGDGVAAQGRLEAVAGRTWWPIVPRTGEQNGTAPPVAGGSLYHYLAYSPGARLSRSTTLRMTWNGDYRLDENNSHDNSIF